MAGASSFKDKPLPSFAEPPHMMIIEAPYYKDVADKLREGALSVLQKAGVSHEIHQVPGALEIPPAIQYAVRSLDFYTARKRYDGYIALGCVIRGETSHYDIVAGESARGLMDLSIHHSLAIGNGILTCDTLEQATERANPAGQDKGGWAARTAVEMLGLKATFGIYPR